MMFMAKAAVRFLGILVMVGSLLCGSAAVATVLDFEGLSSGDPIPNGYGGFNWYNTYTLNATTYVSSGYQNGLVSGVMVAYNAYGDPTDVSIPTGTFNFIGADLTAAWRDGLNVQVRGLLGGSPIYTQSLTLSTSGPTFVTFNFIGIDTVEFSASGGTNPGFTGDGTHIVIDNFTFAPSTCGNGTVDPGEQCDDGNYANGDCCSSTCEIDVAGTPCTADSDPCTLDTCTGGTPTCLHSQFGADGTSYDSSDNHCFYHFAGPLDWQSAETACEGIGGYLAVLDSSAENAIARSSFVSGTPWIGFDDIAVEAGTNAFGFVKVTGGPLTFSAFAPGEPNNANTNPNGEDCVQYWFPDTAWNDYRCDAAEPYVCERPTAVCGDGIVGGAEACDQGIANGTPGSCCSSACTLQPAGTECRPAAGECDLAETCNGSSPTCPVDNKKALYADCGDQSDTDCHAPDYCDGTGTCVSNNFYSGYPCTPDSSDCTDDVCDGAGSCTHPDLIVGTPCGDFSDTDCTHPDTCNGSGICLPNDVAVNTACTSDGNQCTKDICNGSGSCTHPNELANTPCGSSADTQCDNPDTCNGSGVCQPNYEVSGTPCGDSSSGECDHPDSCNGSGSCAVNHVADLTPCHGGNNNTCLNACASGSCTPHTFTNCCGNGTLETGELCDDGNQVNGDECSPSCKLNLDHFQCYRSSIIDAQPTFPPPLVLVDALHTINGQLIRPTSICNPADKNGEDPTAASHADHLENYPIIAGPRKDIAALLPTVNAKVVNQFGTIYVDITKPKELLEPTAKELASTPPLLAGPTIDHFTCYKIKRSKGKPKFTPIPNVMIEDEFGSLAVKLIKPSRLCLPTNKFNDDPGAETHKAHLLCYRVKAPFSTPGRVFTNNEFGPGQLNIRFPNQLCVPSVVNPN
ncbi:MAG TPA: lectin-like protein [Candidatus Acidoferrales bacterium]|nr:lectin-like protein [Candidatus Acidoferrales bacterium]